MTKTELLKQLRELQKVEDAYIDSLPQDICAAFYDNGYVNSIQKQNQLLIEEAFGDECELVYWFMWEWKEGYSIKDQDVEFVFNTEAEFYIYFEALCPK